MYPVPFKQNRSSLCDPAGQPEESKPTLGQKVKKESPGESPGESARVPAEPPKRVKNESPESKTGDF